MWDCIPDTGNHKQDQRCGRDHPSDIAGLFEVLVSIRCMRIGLWMEALTS